MRILTYLLLALSLSACVFPKKVKRIAAEYDARIATQAAELNLKQDSITNLLLRLERSYGANDALLLTQDRLQDRLAIQEDELDALKGNLSNTSARLSTELATAREEKLRAEMAFDTLIARQASLVNQYEAGVKNAIFVLLDGLDSLVPPQSFTITQSAGEVTLSVLEDQLFYPRSTERLKGGAAPVLRAVTDALQSDPLLKLTVVGHTDNQPNPLRNTSNWEFAALRATRIADELAQVYYLSPNRLLAASHGEYGPAKSNATEEGRRANRRIDFVLRNNVGNLLRELGRLGEKQ
ncbi:OmpA family protein [Neolewinella lacunae]|uniref:OmpA family protein n=1 Tax=Neolewinella lacunae TaxID=1517758 RepID=A0A923PLK0_9BACT|nr:OmpA family protein [Neolewinella lacunae]MBC6996398.1 OmpA family protein [Neolewinella lacunae]MDN3633659.1 OmpA family protein [Neolewinella lacunae]